MAHAVGEPAFEDLTARARIRDAALRLFAERGIDGATIRDIARAAGVSGGLVRHHFGSKEALHDACDSYALDRLMSLKVQALHEGEQALAEGRQANPGLVAGIQPAMLQLMRYIARSMIDGSASAASLFDQLIDLAERWVIENLPGEFDDPRAYAAMLVAMQTGPLMLHEHVSRALGADIFSPVGHLRMSKATVDFHSHALVSPEMAAQAHAIFDRLIAQQSPASPEPPGTRSV